MIEKPSEISQRLNEKNEKDKNPTVFLSQDVALYGTGILLSLGNTRYTTILFRITTFLKLGAWSPQIASVLPNNCCKSWAFPLASLTSPNRHQQCGQGRYQVTQEWQQTLGLRPAGGGGMCPTAPLNPSRRDPLRPDLQCLLLVVVALTPAHQVHACDRPILVSCYCIFYRHWHAVPQTTCTVRNVTRNKLIHHFLALTFWAFRQKAPHARITKKLPKPVTPTKSSRKGSQMRNLVHQRYIFVFPPLFFKKHLNLVTGVKLFLFKGVLLGPSLCIKRINN